MKLSVMAAREAAHALNAAADEAMKNGEHEFEFTSVAQANVNVAWADLETVIETWRVAGA